MRKLVYHVAMTIDGYICHPDGSIDGFVPEGEHVTEYLDSLKDYDTVIMGRKTYEFGYDYGLKPGQVPYGHMRNYVFSKTLDLVPDDGLTIIKSDVQSFVTDLKIESGTDIYLCGGGQLAGYLLELELIDTLIIKLNPVLIGDGIALFGTSNKRVNLKLTSSKAYDTGVSLLHYDIEYPQ